MYNLFVCWPGLGGNLRTNVLLLWSQWDYTNLPSAPERAAVPETATAAALATNANAAGITVGSGAKTRAMTARRRGAEYECQIIIINYCLFRDN